MTPLAQIAAFQLGRANLCPDCRTVTNAQRCPTCASESLMNLARVLDRQQKRVDYVRTFDESRYPLPYLFAQVKESTVQSNVISWLAWHGVEAFSVDAGAKQLRASLGVYRGGGRGATDAGVSDIAGTLPDGRALYLEVKAPKWLGISEKTGKTIQLRAAGEASAEQLDFLDRMQQSGALVGIVWAVEDAESILREARVGN